MDRITTALLAEFVSEHCLGRLAEDTAFEHFCGYLVTASHFSESFSSEDISVGGGGDSGIDCITIIVNGCVVTDPEEVKDLEELNGYLDVTFIFVQAERSSSFDSSKIGQFGYGVLDFFSESPKFQRNEDVKLASQITNEVFKRSIRFQKGNPKCFLYYMTTGKWQEDENLRARRDGFIGDLTNMSLFREVSFDCLGAEKLHALYRASKNAISKEITFVARTVLPDLPSVEQAYIGVLPAPEFMKLIENDNDEILASLFYHNVRHWQEWNPVNTEMNETLGDEHQRRYFPLLNNGVTIIARHVAQTANKFLIEDYQIVNGCQTSHVLYENRATLSSDVCIPVRLIATEDSELRNRIIKATNRQTQVPEDQLLALSDFAKRLEDFFPTHEGRKKLYYERRSRQYNVVKGIEKVRVLDMRTVVRAFASVFLELPHRTTRNYKALIKKVGTDIFGQSHLLVPYYAAGYAYYRLDYLFRNQVMKSELKPARYHLLFAFRLLYSTETLPRMNSHEMERYCNGLLETLWDDGQSKRLFEQAEEAVRAVAAGNLHRDNIRTETFTADLKAKLT